MATRKVNIYSSLLMVESWGEEEVPWALALDQVGGSSKVEPRVACEEGALGREFQGNAPVVHRLCDRQTALSTQGFWDVPPQTLGNDGSTQAQAALTLGKALRILDPRGPLGKPWET